MEQQTKDYVRYLLGRFKEVYAENLVLKTMFQSANVPGIAKQWELMFLEILNKPETKQAMDEKFNSYFEYILSQLDNNEKIAELMNTPTKGLPQ